MRLANENSTSIIDRRILSVGICLMLAYWVLDAALDAAVFHEGSFAYSLVAPPVHQIVDRFLVVALLVGSSMLGQRAAKKKQGLELALQEALKSAEQERAKLVAVVEAMGDGISIQSPDLTVVYQNRVHQQIVGSHAGEPCYRAYRDESDPCPECHLQEAFRDGGLHRIEVSRPGDQGTRWYEIMGSAARDEAGVVTAGVEVMRDITERKATEQAISKQAALLQHLIDTLPNPVYYQDPSGRLIWCNAAFACWVDKPRELLVGRTLFEVASQQVSRVLQEREPAAVQVTVKETTLPRADGEERDVILYRSVFTAPEGERGGQLGVIIDITARKRAEREIIGLNAALTQQAVELQQVNRELEAFNHAISHDLRTPLTRIYSYAQLLQADAEKVDGDGANYVKGVQEGCLQVEGLLNSLLSLSRVTEVALESSTVDLSQLACQTARELQAADPERKGSVTITPGLLAVGDRQLLQVVLQNLIGNAWKYSSKTEEAVIEVGAHSTPTGDTIFFVKDNGAGFDSSRDDQLFKPFSRLHS
ncbi:PAS domain-containing sensor histidine kinase, partial [Geomonas sp.]|uniref:PAS domain-containing sensor histidine kinase n=1 Tax=Geomonas sp. TaxID=2651584 RepID=UPI002B485AF4